jgi:hypothetical protein
MIKRENDCIAVNKFDLELLEPRSQPTIGRFDL